MVKDAIWTLFKYSGVVFTFSHFNLFKFLCFMISLYVCIVYNCCCVLPVWRNKR